MVCKASKEEMFDEIEKATEAWRKENERITALEVGKLRMESKGRMDELQRQIEEQDRKEWREARSFRPPFPQLAALFHRAPPCDSCS